MKITIALILSGLSMFSLGLVNYVTLKPISGGAAGVVLIAIGLAVMFSGVWSLAWRAK